MLVGNLQFNYKELKVTLWLRSVVLPLKSWQEMYTQYYSIPAGSTVVISS